VTLVAAMLLRLDCAAVRLEEGRAADRCPPRAAKGTAEESRATNEANEEKREIEETRTKVGETSTSSDGNTQGAANALGAAAGSARLLCLFGSAALFSNTPLKFNEKQTKTCENKTLKKIFSRPSQQQHNVTHPCAILHEWND